MKLSLILGPVVQEMSFKVISDLEIWQRPCSAVPNHLCNFCRGYAEEQFSEIILNLDQRFRRCHLKKKCTQDGQRPIAIAHLEPSIRVNEKGVFNLQKLSVRKKSKMNKQTSVSILFAKTYFQVCSFERVNDR